MFSATVGSSTSGAYIESAAGIREGARTGLAAVVTGLLFALTLFFIPLVQPLQTLAYAYGPALIAVGVLMMGSAARIDFEDLTEAIPAFITIVLIVFTYNIANGLTAGLIAYTLLRSPATTHRHKFSFAASVKPIRHRRSIRASVSTSTMSTSATPSAAR
jgi:AGZA family xanthine/uracil permease-like MFS transporter